MTAVFAFLAILLATLTGHAPHRTAPAQHLEQAQVSPSAVPLRDDHAQGSAQRQVGQQSDQHTGTVAPAPVLDPEHPDYAPQNPGEVIGRQIDCPDGQVGTEDAAGVVHCR